MVMNEIYIEVVDRGIRHFALSAEDSWFDWLRSESRRKGGWAVS